MSQHVLETWRRRAEQQSFNMNILREISELKIELERKIVNLRIQGNYHEVAECERLVTFLNWTEGCMRKMLNNQGEKP